MFYLHFQVNTLLTVLFYDDKYTMDTIYIKNEPVQDNVEELEQEIPVTEIKVRNSIFIL